MRFGRCIVAFGGISVGFRLWLLFISLISHLLFHELTPPITISFANASEDHEQTKNFRRHIQIVFPRAATGWYQIICQNRIVGDIFYRKSLWEPLFWGTPEPESTSWAKLLGMGTKPYRMGGHVYCAAAAESSKGITHRRPLLGLLSALESPPAAHHPPIQKLPTWPTCLVK